MGVYGRCRKRVSHTHDRRNTHNLYILHIYHTHTHSYLHKYTYTLTQALLGEAQQVHLGLRGVEAQGLLVPVDGLLDVAPQGAHVRAVRHRLQVRAVELCEGGLLGGWMVGGDGKNRASVVFGFVP